MFGSRIADSVVSEVYLHLTRQAATGWDLSYGMKHADVQECRLNEVVDSEEHLREILHTV